MSTTTIRLPAELKTRIAAAAKRAGTSTHSFILEALAQKAAEDEAQAAFMDEAERRYGEIVATGKTIPWSEMRQYLVGRVGGQPIALPRPRKLAR